MNGIGARIKTEVSQKRHFSRPGRDDDESRDGKKRADSRMG